MTKPFHIRMQEKYAQESNNPYFDSAQGQKISRERALKELKRHGFTSHESIREFDEEMGIKEHYDAQAVLRWLGY